MKGNKAYLQAQSLLNRLYREQKSLNYEDERSLYEKYLKILKKSAYSGNSKAQFELALQYEDVYIFGINPHVNPKKSFYWYKKALDGNIPEAYNNLALLYEKGNGCPKDLETALCLYRKSADLGCDLGIKNYKLLIKQIKSK